MERIQNRLETVKTALAEREEQEEQEETSEYQEFLKRVEADRAPIASEVHEIMLRQIAGLQMQRAQPIHLRNRKHYHKSHRDAIKEYEKLLNERDWRRVSELKQEFRTGAIRRQQENETSESMGWKSGNQKKAIDHMANHYGKGLYGTR